MMSSASECEGVSRGHKYDSGSYAGQSVKSVKDVLKGISLWHFFFFFPETAVGI